MRRALAASLALSILWSSLPVAPAAAQPEAAPVAADPLTELLDARELRQTRNPVVASFLAGEGAALVPEELRQRALQQLRGALKSQTDFMGLMLAGVGGVLGSDTMKKQQEAAIKLMKPGAMLGAASHLEGLGCACRAQPGGAQERGADLGSARDAVLGAVVEREGARQAGECASLVELRQSERGAHSHRRRLVGEETREQSDSVARSRRGDRLGRLPPQLRGRTFARVHLGEVAAALAGGEVADQLDRLLDLLQRRHRPDATGHEDADRRLQKGRDRPPDRTKAAMVEAPVLLGERRLHLRQLGKVAELEERHLRPGDEPVIAGPLGKGAR